MTTSRWLLVACSLIIGACQTYGEGVPARIIDATDLSRASLQVAVKRTLGTEVLLADDAFTKSSVLTIEQNQPGTLQNPVPQGRVTDMPVQLRLLKRGNDCYLIDARNQSEFRLANTRCVAE